MSDKRDLLTAGLRQDLEAECLKPGSMKLQEIGLGFLKFLSSHRGLTYVPNSRLGFPGALLTRARSHELFDEYTRRQFLSKAPAKNPFGTAETPARFADFDVFTKVCCRSSPLACPPRPSR